MNHPLIGEPNVGPKTYLGIDGKNWEFKPPSGDVLRIQWGYTDNLRIWMNYGESPMNGGFSGKTHQIKNKMVDPPLPCLITLRVHIPFNY